jgi:hypothetical protein
MGSAIGAEVELDRDALDELGASFRGELVRSGDPTGVADGSRR